MSGLSFFMEEWANKLPGLVNWQVKDRGVRIGEIAFDSRRIFQADRTLFVAIQGENRDGHAYLQAAYDKGVRFFIVENLQALPDAAQNYIQVKDSLAALQAMAGLHRAQFDYPLIAITGSNGKTIVKEWLATVLGTHHRIAKSPKSYNSQIGVPISLLEMAEGMDYALIEAGISQPAEMEKLEAIIRPDYGILTHFGDAHAEGFENDAQKLREKLELFRHCKCLFLSADNEEVLKAVRKAGIPHKTIGRSKNADLHVESANGDENGWTIRIKGDKEAVSLRLEVAGQAALENVLLVILVSDAMDNNWASLQEAIGYLHPVSMRMEMITDNPEVTIINDAYTADRASVENAFAMLEGEAFHESQAIILSDLEHQGSKQEIVQRRLLQNAIQRFGTENIDVIGPIFSTIAAEVKVRGYVDTTSFLEDFDYDRYQHKTVLLKGARKYALERCLPYLSRRAVTTMFKINMNALTHNLKQFRLRLPSATAIMAMVKASAYGSGSWEIAQALEQEGVDFLAVAYTSEGIELRNRGISLPILVLIADPRSLEQLYRYQLIPEIYSLEFLRKYVQAGQREGQNDFPVHIKIDTGMRRLGFDWEKPESLINFLAENQQIRLVSLLSHLSSADDSAQDDISREQISRFDYFCNKLNQSNVPRHILNTAGVLRLPEALGNTDMVRLGIGLYGINPTPDIEIDLQEIGSLHSAITQIHSYPEGTAIGYGGAQKTERDSRIATIPVGYADGIRRSLSNGKAHFLVRGQRAAVIGRICMDMLMLDITDIPEALEGDEVVLFGQQGDAKISVQEIANLCDTIPYEILTGISQRVRRVYVRE